MKTKYSLEKCIEEADRFIVAAQEAINDLDRCSHYSKECATAKRKSMDLTNALVELRKSSHYG